MSSKPDTKSRLSACINTAVVVVIILIAVLLLSSIMTQRGQSLFGFRSFIVLTGSMSPEFEAGSYIIVKEKPTEEIGVGDVISYYVSDGKTVLTHRVVERTGEGGSLSFITRGDANNTNDENPVAPGQVLGTVVLPVNGLGTFLLTLRNPRSLALYAFIILAIFIGPELYRRITRRRRDEGSAAGNARFERSDAARIDAVKDVVSLGREGSPY